jgi:hypothetical protein
MFCTMRSGLPCLTQFVHEDLVGHGCQANEKNAQQGHLSKNSEMTWPCLELMDPKHGCFMGIIQLLKVQNAA